MKKIFFICILFLSVATLKAQKSVAPTCTLGTCCYSDTPSSSNPKGGDPNATVMDGNGTLATNYTATACGLGYVQASKRLGRRNPLNGAVQPATFTITGIPACAIIEQAWVYFGGVSNASTAVNVTIVNPAAQGGAYPAVMIGQHVNMCWGYQGTRNYRADVTPQVTGNGVYTISGIPTNPPIPGQDMNGATLLIVYRDPLQLWTGHIVIGDGCQVNATTFGIVTNTLTGFNSCAASTFAQGFYLIADLQFIQNTQLKMNSAVNNFNYPAASNNWWDFIQGPANPVAAGQSSFACGVQNNGDCYDVVAEGIYWQTNCNTCVVTGMASATANVNSPQCEGSTINLSVVHNATTATTFTWSGPNSFTSTAQNPVFANAQPSVSGIYTVVVEPQGSCVITRTVEVNVYPNPTVTAIANNGPICQGTQLDITATANTSATASYSWVGPNAFSSTSQTFSIPNAMPVSSGYYTLTVSNTYTGAPYTQTAVCSVVATTSAAIVALAPLNVTPTFTICQNTNLALIANAVGATSYSWNGPNNFATTIQNPGINNVNPIHNGDYSVTAYYTSPATTLVCTSSAVSNVSVVPRNPVTPFSPSNFCQNTTITFSANALNAAGYEWYGPNGFYSQLQSNNIPNAQSANAGNYTVNAIFTIGTVSCTTTNFIPVNVIPVPNIAVIPTITVCERESATFMANAPGAQSYTWTGPNNYQLNGNNPVFTNLTPTMSGMYTVTAAFSNGNMTCYNSNATALLVKPILPFNLGPDKMLCSKQDLLLTGPAGATAYNWWGSTSYTSNAQFLYVPSLEPTNSGIYVLEVDLNGCKTFDSIRISVLSPIIFTLTPSNKTICRGDAVNFIVGAAQGSENYAYNWNPDIYLTGPTGSIQAGNPVGTTIYNISAYDIACPNYVIQTSFTLTVNQPPIPNLSLEKNNVCEPLCMLFNSKTNGESLQTVYDFGNNHIVEGDSIMVCLNAGNHYYKISTEGSNGCRGTFEYSVPIVVYPKPGADFYWNPETPNTSNNQVTFFPTTRNGKEFKYSWEFTNSLINTENNLLDTSTLKNPVKDYYENGKFPVMLVVTNEYGCVDTVFKVIIIDEDFNVYIPNTFTPNNDGINDVFNVKGIGLKQEGYYMEIFDRWGTLVFSTKDLNKGWDGTVKGVKAEDGVYIYKVKVVGDNGIGKKEFKGHVTLLK